jgi:hypothetical protein
MDDHTSVFVNYNLRLFSKKALLCRLKPPGATVARIPTYLPVYFAPDFFAVMNTIIPFNNIFTKQ